MRIIRSDDPRPLNLIAVGANGLIAAASAAFGAPGDIEVWDAAAGVRRAVHREPGSFPQPLASLAFKPDGRTLVGGRYSDISEFDAPTGKLLRRLLIFESPAEVALSPDGTLVVSARAVDGVGVLACHVVDVRSAFTHLWSTEAPRALHASPLFSPRGTHFAVAAHDESGVHPRHEIQFRDASTGVRRLTIPQDPAAPVQQLAFTVDGATLLVRTDGNTVRLFDPTTGAATGELAHRGRSFVSGIAVHPRGPVACTRTDGTVTFWNAVTRERLRTLDWKAGRLVSVAFSPDGALGAAGTEDGKVVIWDVE